MFEKEGKQGFFSSLLESYDEVIEKERIVLTTLEIAKQKSIKLTCSDDRQIILENIRNEEKRKKEYEQMLLRIKIIIELSTKQVDIMLDMLKN